MKTTTACYKCGDEIPPAPLAEQPLCTKCRYRPEAKKKQKPWNEPGPDGEPRLHAGYEVKRGNLGGPAGEQRHNGALMHDEPGVDFNYDAIDDVSGAEQARKDRESEVRCASLETLCRMLAFIETGSKSDQDVARRVHIVSHFLRPIGTQSELAKRIGVSQQTISAELVRFSQELAGK